MEKSAFFSTHAPENLLTPPPPTLPKKNNGPAPNSSDVACLACVAGGLVNLLG